MMVSPHFQALSFNLQTDWAPFDINQRGQVFLEFEDWLSRSKTGLGYSSIILVKIQLKPENDSISARPYRTDTVISKHVYKVLDRNLKEGLAEPPLS